MKILLTGAAGSLGLSTLQKLVATDNVITALDLPSRKTKRKLQPFRAHAQIVYGSINDASLMEGLIQTSDVVIHLAAVLPPLADSKPELAQQVNVGGTKVIIDDIKKCNPRCFLIFSSSIAVYGDRLKNHCIKVGDPLVFSEGDYYASTKIRAEEIIRSSGVRYTIFRLTAIMGNPTVDPLMFHMPLDTRIEIASVRDAAEAFVTATTKQAELEGHTYNLGGGPNCRTTYREFLKRMFTIYGLNTKFLPEEAFATQNFHCGWYVDSDQLNDILHFQHDNLESYYASVKESTKPATRIMSTVFSRPILRSLVKQSEPLYAKQTNDEKLIERFFGS